MNRWQMLSLSLWLILFFLITDSTFAYSPKKGNVTAAFGPYIYKANFSDTTGTGSSSPYMADGALMVNGDVNSSGALELNIFHLHKLFYRSQAGSSLVQSTELLQIDMGYRQWWNSIFSTGLAFYSTYAMGPASTLHNDFAAGLTPNTSALAATLYGFDFSVQAEVWSHERFSVMVDAIYSLPLNVLQDEKADLYGVFVGLRYFIQEQQVREKKPNEI